MWLMTTILNSIAIEHKYVWGQMVTGHCGDDLIRYLNVGTLYCTPETNTVSYVNYN